MAHFLFCTSLHIKKNVYKEIAYFSQFLVKDYASKYGKGQPVSTVLITHNA